jgi:hypothetical protein
LPDLFCQVLNFTLLQADMEEVDGNQLVYGPHVFLSRLLVTGSSHFAFLEENKTRRRSSIHKSVEVCLVMEEVVRFYFC